MLREFITSHIGFVVYYFQTDFSIGHWTLGSHSLSMRHELEFHYYLIFENDDKSRGLENNSGQINHFSYIYFQIRDYKKNREIYTYIYNYH